MNLKSAIGKEFELYDISESIDSRNIRDVLADNAKFVLKRHKLLPRGYSVLVPMGGDEFDIGDGGDGSAVGNFEVFALDMDTIVAYGKVIGEVMGGQLISVVVTITEVTGDKPKPRRRAVSKSKMGRGNTPMTLGGLR